MIFAVHDYINYRVICLSRVDSDSSYHTILCMRTNGTIVVVRPFNGEGVCTDTYTIHISRNSTGGKSLRVIPVFANCTTHAIDVMKTTDIDPNHCLTYFNFEC